MVKQTIAEGALGSVASPLDVVRKEPLDLEDQYFGSSSDVGGGYDRRADVIGLESDRVDHATTPLQVVLE